MLSYFRILNEVVLFNINYLKSGNLVSNVYVPACLELSFKSSLLPFQTLSVYLKKQGIFLLRSCHMTI